MKRRYYAAVLLSMAAPFAAAQSSVTLYGVADIGLEYLNNANAAGDKLFRMTSGNASGSRWGLRGVDDWASLPALFILLSVFGFLSSPLTNSFTRYQEHQSDVYGLEVIHGLVPDSKQAAAHAFQILGEVNLADPEPSAFIKIWLYSHPPLKERIDFALTYDPWSKGERPQFIP